MDIPFLKIETPKGESNLFESLHSGDYEEYQVLAPDLPDDLNASYEGYYVLEYLAEYSGSVEIAKDLIERGASPVLPNEYGQTPVQLATKGGHSALLGYLIKVGADVNAKDEDGNVPLHDCANHEVAALLVNAGAEPNAYNGDGETPLHMAVQYSQFDVVSLLLEHRANINAETKIGATPMSYAKSCIEIPEAKQKMLDLLKGKGGEFPLW